MSDDPQSGRRPNNNNNNNNNNQTRKKAATVSNPTPDLTPASATSNSTAKGGRPTGINKRPNAASSNSAPGNTRAVTGEGISRPSSTDSGVRNASDNGGGSNGGNRGKPRQNNRGGNKKPASQGQGGGAIRSNTSAPGSAEGVGSGDALSSLKRVIGDLKQIPPGATSVNSAAPAASDGAGPPRHRKSASTGNTGLGASYSTGGFSNRLGSMQEDAEDGFSHVESEDYDGQPGFNQPGQNAQGNLGARAFQHQPMGSFSAPRFQQRQAEPTLGVQGEYIDSSGRAQLAPNFTFGGNRRRVPSGAPSATDNGEDVAFQFPPQQFEVPNPARRTEASVSANPGALLAEQVCRSKLSCDLREFATDVHIVLFNYPRSLFRTKSRHSRRNKRSSFSSR